MSRTGDAPQPAPRYCLPRSGRLITRRDFRLVYGRGRRVAGRFMTVVAHPRHDGRHRLGLSVSKANGCAVKRNKVKRLMREAFRLERPTLPGAFDIVLIPRQPRARLRLVELRAELQQLLAKLHAGAGRRRGPRR